MEANPPKYEKDGSVRSPRQENSIRSPKKKRSNPSSPTSTRSPVLSRNNSSDEEDDMFKLKDKYIVEEEEEEELQQHHQLVEPALTQQEADEIIQLISDSAKIICLNVGGKRFVTTQGTLCSKGSNFFTSLLSGRHTATKDDKGAYFIDRNGEVFHTILEFFRTGQVDYSSVVSKHILVREAQFYCVDELVKMITQGDCEDEVPVIRYDGYYVYEKDGMEDNPKVKIDSEICRSIRALYFLVDGRCMFSFGCNAENNLVVFNETQTLPDMW
eukprot:CAMPEP_0174269726 /NCGR_PEP_ID=MMETSP0439-20130205/42039_1 /TAXON_ID=0 /ORGANISM="Stereomyxa ramosa, Strain Chinc5" /LENGTH=270 /DNA_ID=CAMNT_0015358635 /DNA_START=59 /DNA_END=868 /DNA_ORIENTATION=+